MQKMVFFHGMTWLSRNKDTYPKYIFTAILAVAVLVSCSFILIAENPAAGEIVQNTMIEIGILINVGLVAGFVLVFLSFMAYGFGKGITINLAPAQTMQALPEYSIEPDILIVRREGESKEDFDNRIEAAVKTSTMSRWVVVIWFRLPNVSIFGTNTMTYTRDEPIFLRDEWPKYDGRVSQVGTMFTEETLDEYNAYIRNFVRVYREWAPRKKIELSAGKHGGPVLEILKHSANVLLFILLSISAFGQKFEQVNATPISGKIPDAGLRVTYEFEKGDLYRTSDGRKSFSDLLKSVPNYRDGGGGKLISIRVATGKKEVVAYKSQAIEQVAEKSRAEIMRPNDAVNPDGWRMPDSIEMQVMAEKAKYEIWKASQQVGAIARPWWEVVMTAFWVVLPFLVVVGGVLWFAAMVFAREGMLLYHKNTRAAFAVIAVIAGGVLLVNILLTSVWFGFGPVALIAVAGAETFIAYKVVSWIIPDFRPARGNEPERGFRNNNFPQLNG